VWLDASSPLWANAVARRPGRDALVDQEGEGSTRPMVDATDPGGEVARQCRNRPAPPPHRTGKAGHARLCPGRTAAPSKRRAITPPQIPLCAPPVTDPAELNLPTVLEAPHDTSSRFQLRRPPMTPTCGDVPLPATSSRRASSEGGSSLQCSDNQVKHKQHHTIHPTPLSPRRGSMPRPPPSIAQASKSSTVPVPAPRRRVGVPQPVSASTCRQTPLPDKEPIDRIAEAWHPEALTALLAPVASSNPPPRTLRELIDDAERKRAHAPLSASFALDPRIAEAPPSRELVEALNLARIEVREGKRRAMADSLVIADARRELARAKAAVAEARAETAAGRAERDRLRNELSDTALALVQARVAAGLGGGGGGGGGGSVVDGELEALESLASLAASLADDNFGGWPAAEDEADHDPLGEPPMPWSRTE